MSNLELISYKEYPQDQYTKAICIIRIDGKHVVSYAKKLTKDGKVFWSTPNHSVTEDGSKSFIEGYMCDSRFEDTKIKDFVREQEKRMGSTSMSGVAENAGLPF